MGRPTPLIRSLTEVPSWNKKQCTRCGRDFWVLPSKRDAVNFCAKDCRCPGVKERLMAKIQKTPDGHWLWMGACGDHGYGNIKDDNGNQWRTHRLSYTLFVEPIPEGLDVLHKPEICVGHYNCCAPEHLYVGTDENNAGDRVADGRQDDRSGEKCPTHKLTTEQVIEIRSLRWTENASRLATRFGTTSKYIWVIWMGNTWAHLPPCPPRPANARVGNTKLTWEIVRQIRAEFVRGTSGNEIAKMFSISPALVSDIRTGRRWKE